MKTPDDYNTAQAEQAQETFTNVTMTYDGNVY